MTVVPFILQFKKPINSTGRSWPAGTARSDLDVFVDAGQRWSTSATPMPMAILLGDRDRYRAGAENNFPSYESAKHFEVAGFLLARRAHCIVPEVMLP